MPSRSFTTRLDSKVADRLEQRGNRAGLSRSALAQRYIDEGMRTDDHPGIVFRDGPAGRRAALVRGPDVWQIVGFLKSAEGSGRESVQETAAHLNLSEQEVQTAVSYYAAFPDEVDDLISRNDREAEAAEAAWLREQALLG